MNMNNNVINTFKEIALKTSIILTYRVGENKYYEKYILKMENKNFYNEKTDVLYLKCGITNKLLCIKGSDICSYKYVDSDTDEMGKLDFDRTVSDLKSNYEKYSLLNKSLKDFDDLFFRTDYGDIEKKLILLFGETISLKKLIDDLNGNGILNKEELDFCKNVWIKGHEERRLEILNILESEKKEAELSKDGDMVEELDEIKKEYINCLDDYTKTINSFKSLKKLSEYWHPLVLPAPEIYRFNTLS